MKCISQTKGEILRKQEINAKEDLHFSLLDQEGQSVLSFAAIPDGIVHS